MVRKTFIVLLVGLALFSTHLAQAQHTTGLPLLAVLSPGSSESTDTYAPLLQAFRQGLHDLGYAEGKNIQVEYRYA